jgi:DNA-binding CsgD family transcriptional regulator
MHIVEAICHYKIGEKGEAQKSMFLAYEMAKSDGLDMLFIEFGNDMRALADATVKSPGCPIPINWLKRIAYKASAFEKRIGRISAEYRRENNIDGSISLSRREADLLSDLSYGLSRSEIAASREMSVNTVKSVLQMCFAKLGAENGADAIRIAIRRSLI